MQKKKILFYIPSLSGGGAERVLINLLNCLDSKSYQIDLCLLLNKNIFQKEVSKNINSITVVPNKLIWSIVRICSVIFKLDFPLIYFFKRKVKIKTYDSVICFMDGEFTHLLSLFPPNTTKITWVHSNYSSNPKYQRIIRRLGRQKMKKAYNHLDSIVFVSNDIRVSFLKEFGIFNHMPVIYNIVMNEKLRKFINVQHLRSNIIPTGIAVGRLEPVKGFDRLIRVASLLKRKGNHFKINILGEGPEKEKLQDLILKLDLQEEVKLLGFISNPYPIMSQSDFLVLTSIAEGLPTVLCEAFYLGLPIISTKCSGSNELLDNGKFGILSEQKDDSLYNAFKLLLSDEKNLQKYANLSTQRAKICDEKAILAKVQSLLN